MNSCTESNDANGGCQSSLAQCSDKFHSEFYVLSGKGYCGKTFFIINDIYVKMSDDIEQMFIISENKEYLNICDKLYSLEHLNSICKFIKKNKFKQIDQIDQTNQSNQAGQSNQNNQAKLLIIDKITDSKIFSNELFRNILFQRKSLNLSIIISMPNGIGIPPEIRSTIDTLLLGLETNTSQIKRIYEHYISSHFKNYTEFEKTMMLVSNQEFMKISNNIIETWYVKAHKQLKLKKISSPIIELSDHSLNQNYFEHKSKFKY